GLARKLRPRKVSEFASLEDLRHDLIESIAEYRREQSEMLVADFDPHTYDAASVPFARIGGGSLGGKARGLAVVRSLLGSRGLGRRFTGVHTSVPASLVLGTDCFDRYLAENRLLDLALNSHDDDQLLGRFLDAPLPGDVMTGLARFLESARWPLAVRSS